MERACFLLQIKKGKLEDYLKAHKVVWPEMLDAIRQAGIRNYSMFYKEDGLLVGYLEAENVQESLSKVAATDVSRRWEERMSPFFEDTPKDGQERGYYWLKHYFFTP